MSPSQPLPLLRLAGLIALLALTLILAHAPQPAVAVSSSAALQYWQFCYYAENARGVSPWTVITSGSFVSGPLFMRPTITLSTGYYQILSMTGVRTQTTVNGTTSAMITGLYPVGGYGGNDNIVATFSPILSGPGVSFMLDRNVTVPGTTSLVSAINVFNGPPRENDQSASKVGLSYFVYSLGNNASPLQCPPPARIIYKFAYTATPTSFNDGAWSSCVSGTISLVGPYSYVDVFSGSTYDTYIAADATGQRIFANNTYTQVVNVTGVSADDGSDFTFYDQPPAYFDSAGVALTFSPPPLFQNWKQPIAGISFVNLYTNNHVKLMETSACGTYGCAPDSSVDFQLARMDSSAAANIPTCQARMVTRRFDFCYVATGHDSIGRWAVITSGTMLANANGRINGSFYVTAARGTRTQVNADGSTSSVSITGLTTINGYDVENDNRLYIENPTLSAGGITFTLASAVQLPYSLDPGMSPRFPAAPTVTLAGSPARELFVDTMLFDYSSFIYVPGNVGNFSAPSTLACNVPQQFQSQLVSNNFTKALFAKNVVPLKPYPFYYTSTVPDTDGSVRWSRSVSGVLFVIGPQVVQDGSSGANQRYTYVISTVSGEHTSIDNQGNTKITAIASLNRAWDATNVLYSDELFDSMGFSFKLVDGTIINLSTQQGYLIDWISTEPDQTGLVSFEYTADSSVQFASMQPGDSVSTTQREWTAIVAVVLLLIGSAIAVYSVEQIYLQFRRRRSAQLMLWVTLTALALAIGAIWSAQLMLVAGTDITCPRCLHWQEMHMATPVALIALVPAFVGVFLSMFLMLLSLNRYENGRLNRVRAMNSGAAKNLQFEGSTNASTLEGSMIGTDSMYSAITVSDSISTQQHDDEVNDVIKQWNRAVIKMAEIKARIRLSHSWHAYAAGAALTVGIVLTRATLMLGIVAQATTGSVIWNNVISILIVFGLSTIVVLTYFYAPHYRFSAPVLLAAAVVIDAEMALTTLTAKYAPSQPWDLSSSLYASRMTETTCFLTSGIVGAVAFVGLVTMQFVRIRASRRLLAAQMKHTKSKLNTVQQEVMFLKNKMMFLNVHLAEFERNATSLAMLRPIQGEESVFLQRVLSLSYLSGNTNSVVHRTALVRSAAVVFPSLLMCKAVMSPPRAGSRTVTNSSLAWTPEPGTNPSKNTRTSSIAAGALTTPASTAKDSIDLETIEPDLMSAIIQSCHLLLVEEKPMTWITSWNQPASETTSFPTSSPILGAIIAGYRPTLGHVLSHPTTCELLKDAMVSAACSENILFLCVVARFKLMEKASSSERAQLAQLIHEEFIREGSSHEININSALRNSISGAVQSTRSSKSKAVCDLFVRAEREIFMLVETNNWKTFVGSPQYALCGQILARNALVMTFLQAGMAQNNQGQNDVLSRDALLSQTRSSDGIGLEGFQDPGAADGLDSVECDPELNGGEASGARGSLKEESDAASSVNSAHRNKDSVTELQSMQTAPQ